MQLCLWSTVSVPPHALNITASNSARELCTENFIWYKTVFYSYGTSLMITCFIAKGIFTNEGIFSEHYGIILTNIKLCSENIIKYLTCRLFVLIIYLSYYATYYFTFSSVAACFVPFLSFCSSPLLSVYL